MTVTITGGRTSVTVSDSGSSVTITGSRTGATIAEASVGGGGVTDHGALTGLADDDHAQYALADGTRGSFEAAGAVTAHAGATDPHGDRAYAAALVDDLSGVTSASTARTNLGLGTAATTDATAYATAGHNHSGTYEATGVAAALVDDLSGVTNASTARANLGLGTAATTAATAYDAAGSAAAAQAASQPLDSDLTAIAALSTTTYGRAFLALADAAAGRTALGLGTAATTAATDYATAGHNHSGTYDPAGTAAALVDDLSGVTNVPAARTALAIPSLWMPTGALAETFPAYNANSYMTVSASGRLLLTGITLYAGQVITSVTFRSKTAMGSPTIQIFGLWNASLEAVRLTGDDGSTAWGANADKTLTLTSTYTVSATARYYLGWYIKAATGSVRSLFAPDLAQTLNVPPAFAGWGGTAGAAAPSMPHTASALTTLDAVASWGWVS